ncbi:MAG TPA: DUF4160 domain-containing protein [Bacteroidetes bacterium]|nr:DUF4160 domain-containing protein [Bacteroidota bacterium]
MNFKDHTPPHFHVWYGDYEAIVTIKDSIVKGEMPQRALKMIFDWLEIHRAGVSTSFRFDMRSLTLRHIQYCDTFFKTSK